MYGTPDAHRNSTFTRTVHEFQLIKDFKKFKVRCMLAQKRHIWLTSYEVQDSCTKSLFQGGADRMWAGRWLPFEFSSTNLLFF